MEQTKQAANSPKKIGRPVGSANKATTAAREAIAEFVDGNAHRLVEWLDAVATGTTTKPGDPAMAFKLYMDVVEYHVPKLARTEITGVDGEPVRLYFDSIDLGK